MAGVNTVLGPVSPGELGITLIHEHLTLGFAGWDCDALAAPYDREEIATACVQALEEAKTYGLKTLVEASPNDHYGRCNEPLVWENRGRKGHGTWVERSRSGHYENAVKDCQILCSRCYTLTFQPTKIQIAP